VRPSARREQRVYPDPNEEEEPIGLLDDLPGAMELSTSVDRGSVHGDVFDQASVSPSGRFDRRPE
jgi:hypothetical protein